MSLQHEYREKAANYRSDALGAMEGVKERLAGVYENVSLCDDPLYPFGMDSNVLTECANTLREAASALCEAHRLHSELMAEDKAYHDAVMAE